MDNSQQPLQAPSNPFGDPFGTEANVQTYQPPHISSGTWNSHDDAGALGEDDEPFSAAHLAAVHEASVPAIVPQPQPSSSFSPTAAPKDLPFSSAR